MRGVPATPFFAAAEPPPQPVEETPSNVIADENQKQCPICGERFEQFWDRYGLFHLS